MPAISSDDLWCETTYGPAKIAQHSPCSRCAPAKISEFTAENPLVSMLSSPIKQRSTIAPQSIVEFCAAIKSVALTSMPIYAPESSVPF